LWLVHLSWLAAGLELLLATGCTSKKTVKERPTFPVKGTVLFEGRPVGDALVVFHPPVGRDDPPVFSMARTDANGRFEVSTYKPYDGAPAGSYRVSVVKYDDQEGTHLLPPTYADPATSGLRVEVRDTGNELEPFRLRRP
jgi:hypothetical protein